MAEDSPVTDDTGDEASVTEAVAIMRSATARIESLAVAEGEFCVVCGETGVCPTPVTDRRFESYEDAETARAAARAYREALAELDPALSEYDLRVSTVGERSLQFATTREVVDHDRPHGLPRAEARVTLAGDGYDEWLRVENAPVVHLTGPDALLDDELIGRQLDSKL